jgi:hypothetical protein
MENCVQLGFREVDRKATSNLPKHKVSKEKQH